MGQLEDLTELNKLELDNNGLKEGLQHSTHKTLWVSLWSPTKHIRKYENVDWPLKKLETLTIMTSHLTTLRNFMHTGLDSLQNLNYAYGSIAIIEEMAFAKLPKLKAFWAPENQIEELPGNLFADSPNLEQINLKDNKIRSFTNTTFSGLKLLTKLDLESNQIENIPDFSFNDTVALQELVFYKVG